MYVCNACITSLLYPSSTTVGTTNFNTSESSKLDAKSDYSGRIKYGPTDSCWCCKQCWFPFTMVTPRKATWEKILDKFGIPIPDGTKVCSTCAESIRCNKLPSSHVLCQSHALHPIPPELTVLTDLEEQLVSMRIPFMQIVKVRIQQQAGLKGSVVNLPTNLNKVTSVLPRSDLDEHAVIVRLKRKLCFPRACLKAYVRPSKVRAALGFLLPQPLY